jgi:peptidoglycan/LPS O-acetylase OafA/YrhL
MSNVAPVTGPWKSYAADTYLWWLPRPRVAERPAVAPEQLRSRLPSLSGTRVPAAILVFGFHMQIAGLYAKGSAADATSAELFEHGTMRVSFFFLLSGFVLSWAFRPGEAKRRSWRKRAARVFPNHAVTALVALAGAAGASAAAGADSWRVVLPDLFLVQSWVPDQKVYFGLNTVSWSLSCEVFFYLIFPFVIRAVDRLDPRRLWPVAAGLVAVVWSLPVLTSGWSQPVAYWFIYVFPPVRALEFVLGVLMAQIVRKGRWIRLPVWVPTVTVVAVYLGVGYLPVKVGYVAAALVPLVLLVPALAQADLDGRRWFWARPKMVWLGELTFAFYLVHQLVIRFTLKLLHVPVTGTVGWGTAHSLTVELTALAAAFTAALLLHRMVELPLNDRLRGR